MATSTSEDYPPLLSLAVHEFRTPASVVGGYLRMLQRDTDQPLTERQRKMVEEAEKSCARLVAIVAELSEIGKFDSDAIKLNAAPVDVFALIADVAAHVHEARDRDVQLSIQSAGATGTLNGDAARLRSAFDAVFRAILREKAGPATVAVHARREAIEGRASAVVVVADEGRVQEAYGRPRAAFNEKRGGLGLALPLARRVLEHHGGGVWAPAGADDPVSLGSAIIILPLTE